MFVYDLIGELGQQLGDQSPGTVILEDLTIDGASHLTPAQHLHTGGVRATTSFAAGSSTAPAHTLSLVDPNVVNSLQPGENISLLLYGAENVGNQNTTPTLQSNYFSAPEASATTEDNERLSMSGKLFTN